MRYAQNFPFNLQFRSDNNEVLGTNNVETSVKTNYRHVYKSSAKMCSIPKNYSNKNYEGSETGFEILPGKN
jgi:hypothetical protein